MKKTILILIVTCYFSVAGFADVFVQVCGPDGITPFDCNDDVMVGGKLSFLLTSDFNDYWAGGLFISGEDRDFGTLSGRDYDPNTRDYTGSHFQPAGQLARVFDWEDSLISGFDLYTFYRAEPNSYDNTTFPGDWFVIDYIAEQIGSCDIGFYEYFEDDAMTWSEPVQIITFSQVITRDLDSDGIVDFNDFSLFANEWMKTDCAEPDYCNGADLDSDGDVDYNDLQSFNEFWLWGAPPEIPSEPNENPDEEPDNNSIPSEDPNIIYRIVDADNNNEITVGIGESITLYVDMETNDVNVMSFDIEVVISDTNLGSIDNTEYDIENPPGLGTAQILAEPDPLFIYWGPGIQQQAGIGFFAVNILESGFCDGHLASFVFTCEEAGDVTLNVINWESYNTYAELIFPMLQSIAIHQIEQSSQTTMSSSSSLEMSSITESEQTLTKEDIAESIEFIEQLWQDDEEFRNQVSKEELNEIIDLMEQALEE